MLVEHVRNVLGVADAAHRESSADGTPVITLLACSLMGRTIDVVLSPGTRLAALHPGVSTVKERTTCNYGLDAGCRHVASSGGMVVSGMEDDGTVCAVERDDHPFFVATLYQPQLRSSAEGPHPIWLGFVEACRR